MNSSYLKLLLFIIILINYLLYIYLTIILKLLRHQLNQYNNPSFPHSFILSLINQQFKSSFILSIEVYLKTQTFEIVRNSLIRNSNLFKVVVKKTQNNLQKDQRLIQIRKQAQFLKQSS
ncbi:hypothetical protein ABPG72_015002 [Tetrahymena utriculariae]